MRHLWQPKHVVTFMAENDFLLRELKAKSPFNEDRKCRRFDVRCPLLSTFSCFMNTPFDFEKGGGTGVIGWIEKVTHDPTPAICTFNRGVSKDNVRLHEGFV